MDADILLSEEFANFSSQIAELRKKKDLLNAEFKKLYIEHKDKLKAIDEDAEVLENQFQEWISKSNKES